MGICCRKQERERSLVLREKINKSYRKMTSLPRKKSVVMSLVNWQSTADWDIKHQTKPKTKNFSPPPLSARGRGEGSKASVHLFVCYTIISFNATGPILNVWICCDYCIHKWVHHCAIYSWPFQPICPGNRVKSNHPEDLKWFTIKLHQLPWILVYYSKTLKVRTLIFWNTTC